MPIWCGNSLVVGVLLYHACLLSNIIFWPERQGRPLPNFFFFFNKWKKRKYNNTRQLGPKQKRKNITKWNYLAKDLSACCFVGLALIQIKPSSSLKYLSNIIWLLAKKNHRASAAPMDQWSVPGSKGSREPPDIILLRQIWPKFATRSIKCQFHLVIYNISISMRPTSSEPSLFSFLVFWKRIKNFASCLAGVDCIIVVQSCLWLERAFVKETSSLFFFFLSVH